MVGKSKLVTYKCYISLLPVTWDKLRSAAVGRRITGRELIQALLTQATSGMPVPAAKAPEAPAAAEDDPAYWTSLQTEGE